MVGVKARMRVDMDAMEKWIKERTLEEGFQGDNRNKNAYEDVEISK